MPETTEKYDLLVVGAGAAGCTAALKAARSGLKTLLAERAPGPGVHVQPKLDITQDENIKKIIKETGVKTRGRSNKSMWLSRSHSLQLTSRIHDLFILRGKHPDSYESQLSQKALDAGCELSFNTSLGVVQISRDGFESAVLISEDGSRRMVKPEFVIAADGISSHVLSSCFPHLQEKRQTEFVGAGAMLENATTIHGGVTHVFFDSKLLPGGYFYLCRFKKNNAVAAAALPVHKLGAHSVEHYFKQFTQSHPILRQLFKKATLINYFAGGSHAARLDKHYHKNILLTGDAGRLLDPLLGYGVNHAIHSGYWAAAAIAEASAEEEAAGLYERKLASDLLPGMREGARARKALDSMTNNDFDSIIRFLNHVSSKADLEKFLEDPISHPIPLLESLSRHPTTLLLLRHLYKVF